MGTAKTDQGLFLNLLRKEIVSHILTLRFFVTFALVLLLVFSAFYVSVLDCKQSAAEQAYIKKNAQSALEDVKKSTDSEKTKWENVINKWDDEFSYVGVTEPIPSPRLSVFGKGLSAVWPTAISASTKSLRCFENSVITNPLLQFFRTPNFVYVVNTILSFLALLIVFDAVCGEKQNGTLRLLLSYSVPRHILLLAKWVGGYIILVFPLVIAFFGGVWYARMQSVLELSLSHVLLISLLLIVALLYVLVFFTLGLLVSSVTNKSTTALFISLGLWVLCVAVIPSISPVVARLLSPVPSQTQIHTEQSALRQESSLLESQLAAVKASGSNEQRKRIEDRLKENADQYQAWQRFYDNSQERQTWLAGILSRLSPSGMWVLSASSITGTGYQEYQRLNAAITRLSTNLEDKWHQLESKSASQGDFPAFDPSAVPGLHVPPLSVAERITEAFWDVLLLLFLNVGLFLAAFMKFLRYDVR